MRVCTNHYACFSNFALKFRDDRPILVVIFERSSLDVCAIYSPYTTANDVHLRVLTRKLGRVSDAVVQRKGVSGQCHAPVRLPELDGPAESRGARAGRGFHETVFRLHQKVSTPRQPDRTNDFASASWTKSITVRYDNRTLVGQKRERFGKLQT